MTGLGKESGNLGAVTWQWLKHENTFFNFSQFRFNIVNTFNHAQGNLAKFSSSK